MALILAETVTHASGAASGGTTIDAPKGSLIVLGLQIGSRASGISAVDSAGNAYLLAAHASTPTTGHTAEIWYCRNTPNDLPAGGTFTVTTAGAVVWALIGAAYAIGYNGPLDQTAIADVTSASSFTATTSSLAYPVEVCFACFNYGTLTTYTEDANWTQLIAGGSPTGANSNGPFAQRFIGNSVAPVAWNPSWTPSGNVDGVVATFELSTPNAGLIGLGDASW